MTEQKPSSAVDKDCLTTAAHPSKGVDAPRFPTMLRKMWSGGEVQAWIDANWCATPSTPPTAPERGHVLAALDRLEGSDDDLATVFRAIVRADGEARDAARLSVDAAMKVLLAALDSAAIHGEARINAIGYFCNHWNAAMAGGSK